MLLFIIYISQMTLNFGNKEIISQKNEEVEEEEREEKEVERKKEKRGRMRSTGSIKQISNQPGMLNFKLMPLN